MSGNQVTVVPVPFKSSFVCGRFVKGASGIPFVYVCVQTFFSLLTSTFNHAESAFTTDAPTPCKPPDT